MKILTAIRIGLIAATTFSMAVAYTLWLENKMVKASLAETKERLVLTQELRERDAKAVKRLLEETAIEQKKYEQRLLDLQDVGEESQDFLNQPVPPDIRRLFLDN